MIQNIVFDMGGVLIYYSPIHLIRRLSLEVADSTLLFQAVFQSVEWARLDRGTMQESEALAAMQKRLPPRLHADAERLTAWWELELRPMEGMEALLAELKGLGYGIYLLSNASLRQPEYFPRIPGSQYFDGGVVSAFYKQLKPEREIYETLFRELSLKPETCFFLDDNPYNVEAALRLGMAGTVFHGAGALRWDLTAAGIPVHPEA